MIYTLLFLPMLCLVTGEGKTPSDAETLVKRGPWVVSSVEQDGKAFAPPEEWDHLLHKGDVVTFTKMGAPDEPLDVGVARGKGRFPGGCIVRDNKGKPAGQLQLILYPMGNVARSPILTGTYR